MPLDKFKTQVLLLHSEQSTLDTLSSGFGDRYTVHCATSGSEALNTLGDTPINVIVTAQKLPGMSGIEALREAKKRSPDTIGILLAEDEDKSLEAMVGDREVFQIVRGDVTGDSISKMVEDATQQMRLTAIANSANDAAADVDETSAEHIVMETSENGSTIISDGTGRMPALDPTKISSASAVGSHAVDLLVLTKDDEFLATIKESSRGTHGVHYASTLAQADKIIRKQNVGVAVVDAAMVGEKIEQLTAHLRKGAPRLVSIVAGRRDDGEMMMDLINRSKVYRFLLKPVSPGRARLAVEASVKHHLEAPDAAFKSKDSAKPTPTLQKPQAAPAAKPGPASKAKSEPKSSAADDKAKASTGSFAAGPPLGSAKTPDGQSPDDDALSSAFGDDDSSFTETVTGLFQTVSKKFSADDSKDGDKDESPKPVKAREESKPAVDLDQDPSSSGGSLFQDPKVLGIGAAAIVVVAGVLFWLMGGSDEATESPPSVAETPVVTEAEEARVTEDGSTDLAAPDVEQQISQAIADAESALLESRIDDASAALEILGRVAPDNERLPFLTAQLAQIQLRSYLVDARTAIRESRFEDASNALAAARSLDLPDSTEIAAAELELTAAQDAQQIEEVLALASTRLEEGNLLAPANDNARYYFQLALSQESENVAARQGLSVIASKLAMQARTATDNGNLNDAEALLAESNAIDPDNTELAAAITALADRRAAIAAAEREAEAQRLAEAERRETEAREAAEREAEQQRAAEAAAAAAAAAPTVEAATLADDQPAVEAATLSDDQPEIEAATLSDDQLAASNDETSGSAAPADAQDAPAAATNTPVAAPTSVRDLNRTKYVAPKYPRSAQRRNLSGWVDVVFTVDTTGLVKDIDIRGSEPGETFVAAATRAVEKWEFEPVFENGQVVEKRVGVRMMFALE